MKIKGTHTYIGADNKQEPVRKDIELDVLGFNNLNLTGKNIDEFYVALYFNNAEDVVSTGEVGELADYKFNNVSAFYNGYANGPDHIREIEIRLEDTDNYYNRNIITAKVSTMNGATEEFVNQLWNELDSIVEAETGSSIDDNLGAEKEKADQKRAQAEEDELKIDGDYAPDVIEEAQKIFDTCKLEGADIYIDNDGVSVLVKDTVNNIGFWFDIFPSREGDLEGDWNQYIFHNNFGDQVRSALQNNGRFFEAVFEVAENYAMEKEAIKWNDETNKYEFKTESKKAVKKENKKGIGRYLKEDFYDGDGDYDEADWEEEAMGEEREDVEEYVISFEPGEYYDQYHGEFITEDKDEADDLFDEIKEEHKLDQVDQYIRKVWEWDRVNEEYYETDVEVYFNAGDELEYYDESKKTEDLSVEEENKLADDIEKYLTDNQLYPADVFAADTRVMVEIHWGDWKHDHLRCDDLMKAKGYGLVEEEVTEEDGSDCYSAIRHYEPEGKFDNVDIQESKKTEGYSLGDDKESFDVYKHTADFLNKVGKALEDLGWKFNKEKGKFEKEDITIDMEAIQDNVNDLYIGSNKLKLSKFVDDFSGYEDIGEDTGIIYYVSTKAGDYEARQLASKINSCEKLEESKEIKTEKDHFNKAELTAVKNSIDTALDDLQLTSTGTTGDYEDRALRDDLRNVGNFVDRYITRMGESKKVTESINTDVIYLVQQRSALDGKLWWVVVAHSNLTNKETVEGKFKNRKDAEEYKSKMEQAYNDYKKKTEAKPEEADKKIWEKVEHIVDAADNELGPDQSNEYQYDEHIKFVIYRDFEYEDIFEVYTYVDGEVQEDLDTGDVHLEDLDATMVDIVKKLQDKTTKVEESSFADEQIIKDKIVKKYDELKKNETDNNKLYNQLSNYAYKDLHFYNEAIDYFIRDLVGIIKVINKKTEAVDNENKVLVYQIADVEHCDYAFMDYAFAKEKDIDLKDYKKTAEVQVNTDLDGDVNSILELVFSYGNTNQEYYQENPEARSISVSDILEYNGKKYYVDSFGFEEVVGIQEDNKEVKTEAVRYIIRKNEEIVSPYGNPEDGYTQYSDMNEAIADAEEIDADYIEKLDYDSEEDAEKQEVANSFGVVWRNNKKKTEAEDMTAVKDNIEKAKEDTESTEQEIEQVKGSLEVLKTDEEEAIAGYDTFVDNSAKVVDDELADAIDDEMQEIIQDEKDHIEKLDTIKSTLGENKKTEASVTKFQTLTVDKDGNEMLLKDVSYNNACSWLEKELAKAGSKVVDTETKGNKTIIKADNKTKFEYDEEKGTLKRLEEAKVNADALKISVAKKLADDMIKAMGNDVTGMDKETYYKNTLAKLNDPKYIDSEIKNYECDNSNRSTTMVKDLNDLKKALTEAIDPEAVKEKVEKAKADIGLKQAEEMVDTENELTEGIKKEIIQYAKQQGLDVEKLQKQGELNSVAEALDNIIGEMVSKSANEFMDTTGKNIEWDFEVKDNNINVIWNEV